MGKSLVFSSASEVTTLWRYTNLFIIIIIFLIPQVVKIPGVIIIIIVLFFYWLTV